jgi:hypothetical protein
MVDKDTALKLALEALQWHWGGEPLPTLELKAINAIKEALAQPDDLTIAYMSGVYDGKNKYAPRRKPLTDEEIFEIHKQVDSMQYLTFARAIEAAHGIKGE